MNFYNGMTGNRGDFAVSDSLVQLYDQENDYRRYFFGKNQSTSANSLQWKYDTIAVPHVSDIYTLRIAEGYLNLAEAYAMEDNFQGPTSICGYSAKAESGIMYIQLIPEKNWWKKSGWNAAGNSVSKDIAGST